MGLDRDVLLAMSASIRGRGDGTAEHLPLGVLPPLEVLYAGFTKAEGERAVLTVSVVGTLLKNPNWLWFVPLLRLTRSRWTGLKPFDSELAARLHGLSRGLPVPAMHLEPYDRLDLAVVKWFDGDPTPTLYAGMNEFSVRRFFARLRAKQPALEARVVEAANLEAARLGRPTPLPPVVLKE